MLNTHPVAVDDFEPILRVFVEIRDLTDRRKLLLASGALFLESLDRLDPLRALKKNREKGTTSGGVKDFLSGRKKNAPTCNIWNPMHN